MVAKAGGANMSYFHGSVKGRCRKNSILALCVGDTWVESVSEICTKIVDYFTTHFPESVNKRPTLDGIVFRSVDPIDVLALTVPFTTTGIVEVVLSVDGDKSLGPDVDEVVEVNEIIGLAKKSRKECLIFKVDFENACDSVSWSFLDYMMIRFGFGGQCRNWIKACVFSGNLFMLVNGSPTEEINIQRGLKQGDPLAPFMFLLVVEGLSGVIRSAKERNMFTGFKVGNTGLYVSHLQYADDTLFIGEASMENIWSLNAILRSFELVSDLKVNFYKSSIMGVNVNSEFLGVAEKFLHCKIEYIPFIYLGLPVGYVILGGRVVLLNSVLNSIHIFYLSFMKMPLSLEKDSSNSTKLLVRGPKGSRKIDGVSWSKVCKSKNDGGLGVRDLRVINLVLLGSHEGFLLVEERVFTRFPEDAISDWFLEDLNLLESLNEILDRSTISTTDDSWYWKHDGSGYYSVKSTFLALSRSTTNEVILSVEEQRLLPKVWKTWAPSKVAVFSWQLLQDRLPTRQNLWHWGVIGDVSASMCVLCGSGPESDDHLFDSCNQISPILHSILRWLGVELVPSLGRLEFF
ncbi:hypothetical protein TSUD_186170 [Trifolium subterraneum]|uniref:Reverse transcriptase domain-containing protein n=1 Tax=Trifolium subterraneum TaxID=3900 RepID=A0A2Z6PG01_TRISU|nr:hypothetical protein TSUD_186170 [Trifolium subterraneum]